MKASTLRMQGFTLIEMAVVLMVVGLMLGGLLMPISTQMDQRNYSETSKEIGDIREALLGHAMVQGYLPCPAVSFSDGREDRAASGACNKQVGFLPWSELGVSRLDSWGRLYRYSVSKKFSDSATKANLATTPDIGIHTRNAAGSQINLTNASTIVAAIVCFGKNGR